MFDKRIIFDDLARTLRLAPGLVEIAVADTGGSKFNQAFYLTDLDADLLATYANTYPGNVAFLGGIDHDCLQKRVEIEYGEKFVLRDLTSRRTADAMVKSKAIIVLDIDFKDVHKGFRDLPPDIRRKEVEAVVLTIIPKLEDFWGKGKLWLATFTGNGLHLALRTATPLDCSDAARYERGYESLIDRLEAGPLKGFPLDRACRNAARIFRLPLSVNRKNAAQPVATEVLFYDPAADATDFVAATWEADARACNLPMKLVASPSGDRPEHKEAVKNALTFKAILERFAYPKWDSVKEKTDGSFTCSSPWRADSNPSCWIDENKKFFKDHSSGFGGDIFGFLARMADLDCTKDFRRVLALAEEITGLKPQTPARSDATSEDRYEVRDGGFVLTRGSNGDESTRTGRQPRDKRLSNFVARITAEEVHDDGVETTTNYEVAGMLDDGKALPATVVCADDFPSLGWVNRSWGCRPIIAAGQGARDHLRAAIQVHSQDVRRKLVLKHTGWKDVGGKYVFLHAGGYIGERDDIGDVSVARTEVGLCDFDLPPPPQGEGLVRAIRASLDLLDLGPPEITIPLLAAIYTAPFAEALEVDFALFLVGPTGQFKSEVSAVAQAHFGQRFRRERLPESWSSSANALERKTFQAKDCLFVVDDFAITGTSLDAQRLQSTAERFIRSIGNKMGRSRMKADTSIRASYYPRCLMLTTAEDVPKGQSLRGRMLTLQLEPGAILSDKLSVMQGHAAAGLLAGSMSGYLRWLAPRMPQLAHELRQQQVLLRARAASSALHRRTPGAVATLATGFEQFLNFAVEVGAVDSDARDRLWSQAWDALGGVAAQQTDYQDAENPAKRFVELISASFTMGAAHLVFAGEGTSPRLGGTWGWRMNGSDMKPQGAKIGWFNDRREILLDPEASYTVAKRMARDQGDAALPARNTLLRRLAEQGYMTRSESENKNTHKRNVEGESKRVLVFVDPDVFRTHAPPARSDQAISDANVSIVPNGAIHVGVNEDAVLPS